VLSAVEKAREKQNKSAELSARLRLAEEHNRQLREENEKLKALADENERLKAQNSHYCERVVLLEEDLRWLKAQVFGRTADKLSSDVAEQQMLFNEAEVLAAIDAAETANAARTTKINEHERKHTGGRKAIPANFPRVVITHDLPEADQKCGRCEHHPELKIIGMDVSERYRFTPSSIEVELHQRLKRACECCHEGVKIAPRPPQLLPKTMASGSLLAHLVTSKFDDGLPLYRVSRQLQRSHMDLTPGTAGTWVNIVGGKKVVPVIDLMTAILLRQSFIHMDETYLQVLKSEKAFDATHYMVVRAAGPPGQRIILYNYVPSRTLNSLKQLLVGPDGPYTGRLLTDGLELYDTVAADMKLLHLGCLQHARAYYIKARKVSDLPTSRSLAQVAVEDYFRKVYAVEREITTLKEAYAGRGETLPLQIVLQLRQEKAAPVLTAFKKWVDDLLPGVPPKSALGKALAYTVSQWAKITRYLDQPDMPADNNYCEQQIKRFVSGRKSWIFCDSKIGATASANLYTLVMSARANGLEPFVYLSHLFEALPVATTAEALEALLPWNVKALLIPAKPAGAPA
jgi:transposase